MRIFKKFVNGEKSAKWWIDYSINGTRVRKSISTNKKEAEKVLNKIQSKILQHQYQLPNDEKFNFTDFSKKYLTEHAIPMKAKNSVKADIFHLKHLVEYFGDFNLDEINDYHYEQYRNFRLGQKVKNGSRMTSPTTINREGALLRSILNKAVHWNYLDFNPIKKMLMFKELPKERILTEGEIARLVAHAEGDLKYMTLIALNTGMRRGEIFQLKTSLINLREGFLTIEAVTSKTKRTRDIELNKSMMDLFAKLLPERMKQEYFFENPHTGKPYTDIKKGWATLLKKAGIENLRFHDLRHIFATYGILRGGDLISLQATLGHTQITTTKRYSKAMREGKRKLVNGFNVPDTDSNIIDLVKKTG